MIKFDQIKKAVNRSSVISFDLFDTLVKRDCYKPTEIFYFIEKEIDQKYGIKSHFASVRIQAEITARKKSKAEEVSLDEIYDELSVSPLNKERIKQKEEEYEYNLCQWNPLIKPVYEYCRNKGKRIFIITDIYLPETLIEHILQKLGIQYEALFVSSTLKKMKRNGNLFREVLKQTGILSSDILHIGDNWKSDYFMPKKLGFHAIHISEDEALNLFINRKLCRKNIQYANLCSFINNHADTHSWEALNNGSAFDFFSEAGYEIQGPVLYGYVNWLQEQFEKDGIEKVFFLARDGQLMQKAYRKLKHLIPSKYMYASRKALIIPSLWMTPTIQEIKESIFWGKRGTISSFLEKIGLVPADFRQYYLDAGFSLDKVYEYENLWENPTFSRIFEEYIKQEMISHSHKAYDLLLRYLRQLDFSGKVAVVDIGWFGHMQGALEKIVKEAHISAEIHGYYLGLRPESQILDYIQAKGYLFDRNHHQSLSKKEELFNVIVEMLFTANHGTTLGYTENNEVIIPVLGKWEYNRENCQKDFVSIQACQLGALTFIDDLIAVQNYFLLKLDSFSAFANWMKLGIYPSPQMAEYFGNLCFLDDTMTYLAKPKKCGCYYYSHPYEFFKELKNSFWRSAFLVRALGNRFPFAAGYDMGRKLYCIFRK